MKRTNLATEITIAFFIAFVTVAVFWGYKNPTAPLPQDSTIELSIDGNVTFYKVRPSGNLHIIVNEGIIKTIDQSSL